jgi:hypothetical protein
VDRTDADDLAQRPGYFRPRTAALEFPDGGAGAQELAGQIHADDPVPLLQSHRLDRRVLLKAGIVDQDIDRAEFRDGALEQRFDLIFARHIGLDGNRPPAGGADRGGDVPGRGFAAGIVDHHIRTGRPQSQSNGAADARTGAGHQRPLTGQRTHLSRYHPARGRFQTAFHIQSPWVPCSGAVHRPLCRRAYRDRAGAVKCRVALVSIPAGYDAGSAF